MRYLRHPQVKALETYWYLRLVENTPHVQALYRRLFPKQSELLAALGLDHGDIKAYVLDEGLDALFSRIRADDAFVRDFKLEALLARLVAWKGVAGVLGFHYDPYNFDSHPEMAFFDHMLRELNHLPSEVDDIYYTGALTDPAKTDFFVWYKDDKGKWQRYTPDFVIRLKPKKGGKPGTGKAIIVEIKAERERGDSIDGEKGKKAMALRKWENLNPDRIKYEMIFADSDALPADRLAAVRAQLKP